MTARAALPRDPFEGRGASRTRLRLRIEGGIALVLAIGACGMTAALWFQTLTPVIDKVLR